jgi:transcriptional regulator with PAS, ATPase and Fis domain
MQSIDSQRPAATRVPYDDAICLVGESPAMQRVAELIERVAPTEATVLVTGESGTGKELVARSIHDQSARRGRPFIAVNCGAIPATLIEAELFGYEKGSFTGAVRTHAGLVERANGGTLMLDEISEMPIEMQTPLLRFMETRRFFRVGGSQELATDVRVIAATNRNPAQRWRIAGCARTCTIAWPCFRSRCRRCVNVPATPCCSPAFSRAPQSCLRP